MSLLEKHPDIASLWHPTLNGDVGPEDVHHGSRTLVWWLCPDYDAAYQRAVFSQVRSGGASPYVNGRLVVAGVNDISTTHPDIAALWHPTNNQNTDLRTVFWRNKKSASWLCPATGNSYTRPVAKQVKMGGRSPYTDSSLATPLCAGQTDLKTAAPEVAALWHPTENHLLTPQDVTPGSKRVVSWLCPTYGVSYRRRVSLQVRAGATSPLMTGHIVVAGVNDLTTTHPDIAAQWHREKNTVPPTEVTHGSDVLAWWECPTTGLPFERKVGDHVRLGGTSPVGNGGNLSPHNNLAVVRPDIAALWHPTLNGDLRPEDVTVCSAVACWWLSPDNVPFRRRVDDMTRRGTAYSPVSSAQEEVSAYIESLGFDIIRNDRSVIAPLELDIVIIGKGVAIEFNGTYWHTEAQGKGRGYHKNKRDLCADKGVTLIQVWSDDWEDKPDVVRTMIAHKLGLNAKPRIYARKCLARGISHGESAVFCDANHILGRANGSAHIGLFTADGVLVAVSVWRRDGDRLLLVRYCTSRVVVGGMGKLLAKGISYARELGLRQIVTFADHEVSDGALYEKLGFTAEATIPPDYSYLVGGRRTHKFRYRKERFRTDPKLTYVDGATEKQLARMNGLERVWDSGKTRYVLDL